MEWEPGEEKSLAFFVPHELLGLTMADEEPYVLRGQLKGLDYTEMIVEPGAPVEERTIKLPYSETVLISVEVRDEGTWAKMYVGDSDVPIIVDRDNNHVSSYPWNMSAYLVFEAEEPAAVCVKCEPFTHRGTERRG
jgi:hypothetical protein